MGNKWTNKKTDFTDFGVSIKCNEKLYHHKINKNKQTETIGKKRQCPYVHKPYQMRKEIENDETKQPPDDCNPAKAHCIFRSPLRITHASFMIDQFYLNDSIFKTTIIQPR